MYLFTQLLVVFSATAFVASATETFEVSVGDEVPFMIRTLGHVVDGCYLVTPFGETIEFKPKNNSVEHRYVLLEPNAMTQCQVIVTIINEDDSGEWKIYFTASEEIVDEFKTNIKVVPQEVTSSESQHIVKLTTGQVLPLRVDTIAIDFDGCLLTTPDNETIEFKPIDRSSDDRFKLLEGNLMSQCQVEVTMTDVKDSGTWIIYITKDNERIKEEKYTISVEAKEFSTGEDDGVDTTYLTRINYVVRPGTDVEISIRKIEYDVSCEIRSPSGDYYDNPKIRVVKSKENPYAVCRVVIGPVDDTLLGDWELCQKYIENDQEYAECQLATLEWNNNNTDSYWDDVPLETVVQFVNLDGTMITGVTDSGTLRTCHVVTPDGNDIVMNEDSAYPLITRLTPVTRCSVAIGPITSEILGDWFVYGIYTGFNGVTKRTLPIHMVLYNPEDPYEQAHNITNLDPITRVLNLGTSTDLEVSVSLSHTTHNGCSLRGPDGKLFNGDIEGVTNVDVGSRIACHYKFDPITEHVLGEWTVSLKYQRNNMFTDVRQVFVIKREDPANPIDEGLPIEYHPTQDVVARLGSTHQFSIVGTSARPIESCHVRTPDGLQYTIMDGYHVSGVEASLTSLLCRIEVQVNSATMKGDWVLIARRPLFSGTPAAEERLHFTIFIEDIIEAVPKQITIFENKDFHVRLADATDLFETCKLYGPDNNEYNKAEKDPNQTEQCGFVVKGVTKEMNGTWQIVYGNEVTYRAYVDVAVHASTDEDFPPLTWNVDEQFDGFIGPETIVYCTLRDPQGNVVFDNFGRCKLKVNRISHRHNGVWAAAVGLEGKILLNDHEFSVTVNGIHSENRPTVQTSVETSASAIQLSCTVTTPTAMDVCKFRHSSGKVLIPMIGVAEDKYSFFGNGSRIITEGYENNCGIQISAPSEEDWGSWRCAINTEQEVHYGFLSANNPSAVRNSEPYLRISSSVHRAIQGDEVTISCDIMKPIQYCYFRHHNGTVFNLHPGTPSHDMEYFGAGFSAGECGVKFKAVSIEDSGLWSCNVGFAEQSAEQRQLFDLSVTEHLLIQQYDGEFGCLIVNTTVAEYGSQSVQIDHCRYVRIDGFGFTTGNLPTGYSTTIDKNTCYLQVDSPTILDHHPWAVTVRVQGHHEEYSGISRSTLPDSQDMPPPLYHGTPFIFWTAILLTMLMLPVIAMLITPRKHREWTYNRFNTIRNSFRSSGVAVKPSLPVSYDTRNISYLIEKDNIPQV